MIFTSAFRILRVVFSQTTRFYFITKEGEIMQENYCTITNKYIGFIVNLSDTRVSKKGILTIIKEHTLLKILKAYMQTIFKTAMILFINKLNFREELILC